MIQKNWQELIKPNKLSIESENDPDRKATVVAEPLERGFGLTLGNSLRRILLSSLHGAAVTSLQIDGVLHEFSSIPGVREDVTDIVLNIKALAVRLHSEGPRRMTLKADGPGAVTAANIEMGPDIEVMNPDLVICHLDQGAKLSMELTVDSGKGYLAAEHNRAEDSPIGLIPVDSVFSPVRQVAYRVENSREGQILDYDKLAMPPGSCRTSCSCSSISRSPGKNRCISNRKFRASTAIFCARWTNWNCPYARPIV